MTSDDGTTASKGASIAATRSEAVKTLADQIDVVEGKSKMTLALIGKVSTWFTVDKDHPTAIKVQEQLRQFYSEYHVAWRRVLNIAKINEKLFVNHEEVLMLRVYLESNTQIERKMRSLGAMGFSP